MRVIGVKRTPEPVPNVDAVHTLDQLDLVLAQSDFAVLLLPVTPADRERHQRAHAAPHEEERPGCFNFARGALVVDADLIAAAEAGTIAGAVLDVFRTGAAAVGASVLEHEEHRRAAACRRRAPPA